LKPFLIVVDLLKYNLLFVVVVVVANPNVLEKTKNSQ